METLMHLSRCVSIQFWIKTKNAWIMHQDIPSQQSTALVSNITCHLQLSPCWLFWGFVFRAKLFHRDNQTHLAVVCKKAALFQLGKTALSWVFPSPCASWHAVHFYSRKNVPGPQGKWALTCFPLSLSEWGNPKRGVMKWWENKTSYFFVRIQTVAYTMGH